ncbi:MAG: hypothetical protein JW801_08180 [Bacteroidales bacterium]|nr:hypothetical protein [Bacteroidales bacterium]
MKRFLFIFAFALWTAGVISAQVVYQDVSNPGIYEFLDEMANMQLIRVNSVVKPYSREFIAECLNEVQADSEHLNPRQQAELEFYLKDFNKELLSARYFPKRFDILYYSDSLFTCTINGIFGGQAWVNSNGFNYHRWYGAELSSYMGKHLGFYASMRDNAERYPTADTGIITTRHGGTYRSGDYSEMRGGITYGWKWGDVALVKEYIEWGNSYRYPNIISSKAPSFAQFRLHLAPADWFEFNYVHGWLVSGVMDSLRSYSYNGVQHNIYHSKYISANLFTFKPWKRLNLSVGNSVIYSDQYLNPAYFIPVFFYKSVDHSYYGSTSFGGQNSQMFIDISNRLIRNVHMYYSMFIDVMSFGSLFDPETHANHWSMLGGIRYSNLLPNTTLTLEYVRNHPLVYKNDNLTTLYNSNWYSLGHYLGDNAQELYVAVDLRPWKTLHLQAWFSLAQKGPDRVYDRTSDPVTGIPMVLGNTFMESVEWQKELLGFRAEYQLLNDFRFFVELEQQNMEGNEERYNTEFWRGDLVTFSFGGNFGW